MHISFFKLGLIFFFVNVVAASSPEDGEATHDSKGDPSPTPHCTTLKNLYRHCTSYKKKPCKNYKAQIDGFAACAFNHPYSVENDCCKP